MSSSRRRDIVVPCEGGGHKVRLAGGVRFLARARCPKCRAPVDPTRRRRLLTFITNLRRPASDHALDVSLWGLSAAAVPFSAITVAVLWGLADRWWPATVLLFGPRWVLLLPVPVLMLIAALRDRHLLIPLGITAWLILGPFMGFQTGWRALLTNGDPNRTVTVASFNVRGGDELELGPERLMDDWGADVAAFQECRLGLQAAIQRMGGWHVWTSQTLCLVSRFPILNTSVMEADVLQSVGGSGLVVSHLLLRDEGPFWLTNVHLQTPRDGLALIRSGSLREGIDVLKQDSFLREIEHRQAHRFAEAQSGPHIVVGDFNTPPESRTYRTEWGEWTNAFSVAGFGVGGTRLNGWIRARIDHVVVDESWKVVDAWLGADVGSDHVPILAAVHTR